MSNDHGAAYWCDQYHQLDAQSKAKILELEQRVKVLTDAVIAAAEDGYLYHGPEGMDDVQTKLYEAYLMVKPPLPKESKE